MSKFRKAVYYMNLFSIPRPFRDTRGYLHGHVVHIDCFGDLTTDIHAIDLSGRHVTIQIGKIKIRGLSRHYTEKNGLVALIGSSNFLEIALSKGDAAFFLSVIRGTKVRVGLD